ncbi:MAG: GGDEF domain-containing protein [Phycisphaeraceae bacterium]|nr:GGDEF domain-containing protein [Phycisphaeraceae bacterium]
MTQIDPHAAGRNRRWDDAPLRVKLALLIFLAASGGALVGAWVVKLADPGVFLSVGLSFVGGTVIIMAFRWVVSPLDQLMHLMSGLADVPRSVSPHQLPVARRDEVGRMARIMHRVYISALRDRQEAGRLRRTMDQGISEATRQATLKLNQLAMRDPLTDLGNRRFLSENFQQLFDSCRQAHDDLFCLLIDLDNFKKVNDSLGHAAGDELLIFLGNLIKASVRNDDYTVRLGGDEFLVLMPACPSERVTQFARQLRTLFRQHASTALPAHITADLSIGIASLRAQACPSPQDLLNKADANLYAAKRAGKGQDVGL